MRFGAYRRDYLPARIVEVHFAAGQLAKQAKHLPLFILNVVGAAIAVLMGLISGKGIASNEGRQNSNMPEPYPIVPQSSALPDQPEALSDELQFDRLGAPALGIVLNIKADLRAFVEFWNPRFLYGRNVDENILATLLRRNKAVSLGLIEKFYRAIPAHEKKAPSLTTVPQEYAAGKVLQQGGGGGRRLSLDFCPVFSQVGVLVPGEAHLNKRAVLVFGPVLAAGFFCESALSKPNHTTKYTYYTVSGDTPGAIYSALVKRGPRVGGVKAYAATTAVSSQSGQLIPGKLCSLDDYKFKIDFTIKLPKLRNEAALKGATKSDWKKFASFLKAHEETHRSIWLSCATTLESKVKSIKTTSCAELNEKSTRLWEQMRVSCAKKQDAFDVAEQARLLRHPFVRLVLSKGAKTATALAIPE